MNKDSKKIIKKIQSLKRKTRDRDIRVKLELFVLALKLDNASEATRRRGFGRTFYHKWWGRFVKSGYKLKALKEKTRRPKKSPNKTTYYWEDQIKSLALLGYGAPLIRAILKRKKNVSFSCSTINHILNARKKPKKVNRKKLNSRSRRYELFVPGERIQLDVKYVPKLIDGQRVYAYVAIDECTRWRFVKVMPELNARMTVEFLNEFLINCPFPIDCIQTDNGHEFTNKYLGGTGVHLMDEWCEKYEIMHKLIPPGAKELNGKVERSHRIDEQFFYWRASYSSLGHLNSEFKDWIKFYNEERPHQSLKWGTPREKLEERLMNLSFEKYSEQREVARLKFLMRAPRLFWNIYGSYNVKLAA